MAGDPNAAKPCADSHSLPLPAPAESAGQRQFSNRMPEELAPLPQARSQLIAPNGLAVGWGEDTEIDQPLWFQGGRCGVMFFHGAIAGLARTVRKDQAGTVMSRMFLKSPNKLRVPLSE